MSCTLGMTKVTSAEFPHFQHCADETASILIKVWKMYLQRILTRDTFSDSGEPRTVEFLDMILIDKFIYATPKNKNAMKTQGKPCKKTL